MFHGEQFFKYLDKCKFRVVNDNAGAAGWSLSNQENSGCAVGRDIRFCKADLVRPSVLD
jgi:hypothetical protein